MGRILRSVARVIALPFVLIAAMGMGLGQAVLSLRRGSAPSDFVVAENEVNALRVVEIDENGVIWERSLTSTERRDQINEAMGRLANFTPHAKLREMMRKQRR